MKFEMKMELNSQNNSNGGIKFLLFDKCFNYEYCNENWSIYIGMRYLASLLQKYYDVKSETFDINLHHYYYKIVHEFNKCGDKAHRRNFYKAYQKSYGRIKNFYINEL